MRQIRWFVLVLVSALVLLFGISNLIPLRVNFLFFYAWVNLLALIAGTFVLGALVGLIFGLWHDYKVRPATGR